MSSININIRTDKEIKEQADLLFKKLGLSTSSAINIFLRTAVREQAIPFELRLYEPNEITAAAIEEGRSEALDKNVKGYNNINELKDALEI